MRLYARERCADPRAYYDTVEEVMADANLTADEKEYILKSMAVDAELIDADVAQSDRLGEQPAELVAIHKALNQLGEAHSFEDETVNTASASAKEPRLFTCIVAAIMGNDDLDAEVVRKADTIARLSGGEVIFVSVVPPELDPSAIATTSAIGGIVVAPPSEVRAALDGRMRERKRRVRDAISVCIGDSSNCKLEIRTGLIGDEIVRVVEEYSADLVVIGSHERSWLAELISSDTAQQVARHSRCPVLIVPGNVDASQ